MGKCQACKHCVVSSPHTASKLFQSLSCILGFHLDSKAFCFLYIKAILATEADHVEKLFVCNESLFWLGESCLNYIILELHSHVSLKKSNKNEKTKKRFALTTIMFSKDAPLNYLCIFPSLSATQSLLDLLSPSHPLLPHTSHLSLLHSERPIRRRASANACVIGAVANQCLTDPLSIFSSALVTGSQINQTNWDLESEYLIFHWRNLRNLVLKIAILSLLNIGGECFSVFCDSKMLYLLCKLYKRLGQMNSQLVSFRKDNVLTWVTVILWLLGHIWYLESSFLAHKAREHEQIMLNLTWSCSPAQDR